MVMMMKEHLDIAKTLSKEGPEVVLEFWQQLKHELGALGPPIKEYAEWKKVWSDYKSSLRNKLAHNKRERNSTGGGTNNLVVFTPLDEDVIQLVSLRDVVDGLSNANKFGVTRKRTMHDANSGSLQIENLPTADELVASPSSLVENDVEVEIRNIERSTEMSQTKGPKQLKVLEKQIQRWEDINLLTLSIKDIKGS